MGLWIVTKYRQKISFYGLISIDKNSTVRYNEFVKIKKHKMKQKEWKIDMQIATTLGAVHTHTHTHTQVHLENGKR